MWIRIFIPCLFLLSLLGCGRLSSEPAPPSWTASQILADKQDHPSKIISDGANVYFLTGGTVASQQAGTNNIVRLSLKDSSLSVLVNGGEHIPDQTLALDDRFLYWTDGGSISRVPKEGGQSETIIAAVPAPSEMAVDGENIYWIIWSGEGSPPKPLMVAPKRGGAASRLTPPQSGANGLVIDGDSVYWMTPAGIYKAPKAGGDATVVYPNPSKKPTSGLAQDADNFYFTRLGERGKWGLMKLAKKGGEPIEIAASINPTMELAVDDAHVYYFDNDKKGGSFGPVDLMRVAKGGGEPVMLDKGSGGWVKFIASDKTHIYFTDISRVYALAK